MGKILPARGDRGAEGMSYHSGVCNFCGTGCGHLLQVEGGAVRGVFPSPGHPVGRGRLCVRGWHIHELMATEERIPKPLARGAAGLESVSWDAALDRAAAELGRFRPGEVGLWASPRASNEDVFTLVRLARGVLRTPHIDLLSDAWHSSTVEVLREGTDQPGALGSLIDVRSADFLLVVGTDLARIRSSPRSCISAPGPEPIWSPSEAGRPSWPG
jgi:predicted molibdopterin-dependent oxidoreductase YjgC